ncbi:hypothetical protein [Amycolatopsis sp. NPDC004378]
MKPHTHRSARLALVIGVVAGVILVPPSAEASTGSFPEPRLRGSDELVTSTRLADRRSFVSGDRMFALGDESGQYPASGFHIRGEMGGFWAPPVKLLDGLWLGVDGQWLGRDVPATSYASGYGYERFRYQQARGVAAERVQFEPDGDTATVVGLTLSASIRRTVSVQLDAHSELLPAYPWTSTVPSSATNDLPDTVSAEHGSLVFRDHGTAPVAGAKSHDYVAVVGSATPAASEQVTGSHRGPQEPPVLCPASGQAPARCDDSADGKGAGGGLVYRIEVGPGKPQTLWFAVAGSDHGLSPARAAYTRVLADPIALFRGKLAARQATATRTQVDLPGDRLLQRSVEWSKQNLADSVQQADDLAVRPVRAGSEYPNPSGTVASARWIGAGFPDYPWLFATDGEYSAYAAVAAGDFELLRSHLRALRDVSDIANQHSGKIVHEVVSTGDVYFGANADAGNTDESVKFPSAVALLWRWTGDASVLDEFYGTAVRALKYVGSTLDADHDGWPEGLGNVERDGMGVEKLDNTVYYIRGLLDLADLAASRHDSATATWATTKAQDLQRRFEQQWWAGSGAAAYADSVDKPADPANDNTRIFQRHWTGVTPMEAVLPGNDGRPLADPARAGTGLDQREKACYSGENGLYHTGTGPTSADAGNPGPSCDTTISAVSSERSVFSLNTAIMAVAEGNYGRLGRAQQQRYTSANARIQLAPEIWEKPGAMPEVAPSPDFTANIDRPFTDRSMVLQAWGTYGVLWPVVRQQLGIDPDLGHGRLTVVPQIPEGQRRISGSGVHIGSGTIEVSALRNGDSLSTSVHVDGVMPDITVGAVVPPGKQITSVSLDGHPVAYQVVDTTRGREVHVVSATCNCELRVSLR